MAKIILFNKRTSLKYRYLTFMRFLWLIPEQFLLGIEVFLGIFIGMALLVMFCIGWHVWRAANENPATAVKKE